MSMELYNREVAQAQEAITAAGLSPDDFEFSMEFHEPDPDGGGMFTVYYDVAVTAKPSGKAFRGIGGIGQNWLSGFTEALNSGHFAGYTKER